jgi:hypothetical protein
MLYYGIYNIAIVLYYIVLFNQLLRSTVFNLCFVLVDREKKEYHINLLYIAVFKQCLLFQFSS